MDKANGAGVTPFGLAVGAWNSNVKKDQTEIAWQLLNSGAPINQRIGSKGYTALHHAISYSRADMFETLLHSYDPDLSAVDSAQKRPIDIATENVKTKAMAPEAHGNIVKLLVEAQGMQPTSIDTICAVVKPLNQQGEVSLLQFIDCGADVNCMYGAELLLNLACASRSLKMVRFLISKGAEVHEKDVSGKTALEIATEMELSEIKDFYQERGNSEEVSRSD